MVWTITKRRQKIIDLLATYDDPVNPTDIVEASGEQWARTTLSELQLMSLVYSTWDTPRPGVHWALTETGREAAKGKGITELQRLGQEYDAG